MMDRDDPTLDTIISHVGGGPAFTFVIFSHLSFLRNSKQHKFFTLNHH